VDSSAVAVMAAHVLGDGLRTFTVTFPDTAYDESKYAQAVAMAIGSDHTEVPIGPERFRDLVPCAIEHMDQPTFDYVNSYIVSRAVREAGITVALAGVGGDELFGGYRSFRDVPKAAQAARALSMVPEPLLRSIASRAAGSSGAGHVPRQTRWGKLGDVLASRGRILETYQVQYGLFTRELRGALAPDLAATASTQYGLPRAKAQELVVLIEGMPELDAVSLLELTCFVGERLLRDIDVASMAVSLEVRVPLLDRMFLNAVAGLDSTVRYKPLGEKQVLRTILRKKVNPAVFERPKAGFELPLNQWCREQLQGDIDEMFNDRALCDSVGIDQPTLLRLWRTFQDSPESIYWTRIWAMYVLLHWTERHRVSL
jgi:asparagine synthase (glutamine-hydrolysing)